MARTVLALAALIVVLLVPGLARAEWSAPVLMTAGRGSGKVEIVQTAQEHESRAIVAAELPDSEILTVAVRGSRNGKLRVTAIVDDGDAVRTYRVTVTANGRTALWVRVAGGWTLVSTGRLAPAMT